MFPLFKSHSYIAFRCFRIRIFCLINDFCKYCYRNFHILCRAILVFYSYLTCVFPRLVDINSIFSCNIFKRSFIVKLGSNCAVFCIFKFLDIISQVILSAKRNCFFFCFRLKLVCICRVKVKNRSSNRMFPIWCVGYKLTL